MRLCYVFFFLPILLHSHLKEGHLFSAGPEAYYVKRTRDGGTRQTGGLYGGRISYDRIIPWGLYWGAHFEEAIGKLDGYSGSGNKISSRLTDFEVEARGGYALQFKWNTCFTIIPVFGWGKYRASNHFIKPTPIRVTFIDEYEYFMGGFFLRIAYSPCFQFGLNVKAKYVLDGESQVRDDPNFDDQSLSHGEEWQYDIEIPLICKKNCWAYSLTPFYRLRHFGGMENFPFDFFETKFTNWGLRLEVTYKL